MSDYTPTTDAVRDQYTREQPPHIGTVSEKQAEFDRWLDQIKDEAYAAGYALGRHSGYAQKTAEIEEEST